MQPVPTLQETLKPLTKWLLVPMVLLFLVLGVGIATTMFGVAFSGIVVLGMSFVAIPLGLITILAWAQSSHRYQVHRQNRLVQDVAYLSLMEWYKSNLPTYQTMQKDALIAAATFSTTSQGPCVDEGRFHGHATMKA